MAWKVRADCTYTTATNKAARQAAVEALLAAYPTAVVPAYAAQIGRFAGGVTSQSSTRFTVALDFGDGSVAAAFASELHSAIAASPRSQTLVSVHEAEGF